MCAQFIVRANLRKIEKTHGLRANSELPDEFNGRVLPQSLAPVVRSVPGGSGFVEMKFSMTPRWSKTERVKFATHNARLETVDEKPTWKTPFNQNHCVIPITQFVEPIYEGEWEGNMVRFSLPEEEPLFAAGIYDVWVNKETGEEIESFAILTDEPGSFIEKAGHDRQPVFLSADQCKKWAEGKFESPKEAKDFLRSTEFNEFEVSIDRPLKNYKKSKPK